MTSPGDVPSIGLPSPSERDARIRLLSRAQRSVRRARRAAADAFDVAGLTSAIERARDLLASLATDDPIRQKAAEWFLDNYYLIRRVARQVDVDLPQGFVRRLPELASGADVGVLRVRSLARELVAGDDARLDAGELARALSLYEEATPLTIAELWALPTVLRLRVLETLVAALGHLAPGSAPPSGGDRGVEDAGASVERSVRALRVLAEIDWKKLFVRTSRVETILRSDPAGVYDRMDFETCDRYRKAVEALAWSSQASEETVARQAIELAAARAGDPRLGHVGYYLVDAGRPALERIVGAQPALSERIRALFLAQPTATFFLSAAVFVLGPWLSLLAYAVYAGGGPGGVAAVAVLGLLPASHLGATLQRRFFARVLQPRPLPKLDFSKGVGEGHETLVVIPALLDRARDAEGLVLALERHYLRNPDPAFQFALLTDLADSESERGETAAVEAAARGIVVLNARHGKDGRGPFHLLHRKARWNERERRFMGWERKRGKLEELNLVLRGDETTSYDRHEGDPTRLRGARYVLTLDCDTELGMGAGRRLVGLIAHPLNRATFDETTGRLVSGYTVVQPRVETTPSTSRRSRFARIFAGDVGLDIYSHAVSDLYQDLFGSGIYVGKGIYDVDAFARSLAGRVPENALVSHDLFEGIHGRTALATDITLFEAYPSHYAAYARRLHRWVRGDWQLLPWLLARVPAADGRRLPNTLSAIDRWKIADNMRRSVAGVASIALLVAGWTLLPGSAIAWTLATLALVVSPLVPSVVFDARARRESAARAALAVVFLAHDATIVLDAVTRVLVRLFVTREGLLEWTPMARSEREVGSKSQRSLAWKEMRGAIALSCAIGALVAFVRPTSLVAALPVLALWLLAPELARYLSVEAPAARREPLGESDRATLRLLARRTWLFFETFVGPNDQWLPVDNYQEAPREQTAHRTSPTNVGMMMLSTLSAYDFGYLAPGELATRLTSTLDTVDRLAHHRGHLLNWYETKTLKPLSPEYVSTVDSGNFAGCLLALAQGCRQIAAAPVLRDEVWRGLGDTVDLFDDALRSAVADTADASRLSGIVDEMRAAFSHGRANPNDAYATIRALCDDVAPRLDEELLELVSSGVHRHEIDLLHALRTWMDRLHHQLVEARRLLDDLLPWLALVAEPAASGVSLPASTALRDVPRVAREIRSAARTALERESGAPSPVLLASAERVDAACRGAEARAEALVGLLREVARRAESEALGMDYRLLYDRERDLFRIGHNVTVDQPDAHHYDLLASEARLASYLAIVTGQAPESHWYMLGRPMSRAAGAPVLLSWGGTMFEYLMPPLLMRSQEGTLLAESYGQAVRAHMAYGAQRGTPWGVSESAFARVDAHQTYQYRSFGVPGLGLKRGLADDLVIAPYASLLAAAFAPHSVAENTRRLASHGVLGIYGLFEALSFGNEGERPEVVRSYMAHHQGMSLVALDNSLHADVMVARFHSHPLVQKGELLLNERNPDAPPAEWTIAKTLEHAADLHASAPPSAGGGFAPLLDGRPQAFVLSNGRLSSVVTSEGGGGLRFMGLVATSHHPDPTHDDDGTRIHVRDDRTGHVFCATSRHASATFFAHKASFHRSEAGLSVHVDVTIAPADDVEIRQVTVRNESDEPREVSLTCSAEPVLLAPGGAERHPAFAKLFLESEIVEGVDGLLIARRHRSAKEDHVVLLFQMVHEGASVAFAGAETDRAAFLGRLRGSGHPRALSSGEKVLSGRSGAALDPILCAMASLKLKARGAVSFAFVTAVARSRSAALELGQRYGSMHAVRWTVRDAEQEAARRLARAHVDPALLPTIQRLFSAVLFLDREVRAPARRLAVARPSKERLWGRAISGDDPIVAVRVHDPDATLLAEVLAAHGYLRECGVRIDLVLLDEQSTGYANEGTGTLRRTLERRHCEELIGQRGGIHLLARDQVGDDELRTVEASARALFDTRDVSLTERLARGAAASPALPAFTPSISNDTAPVSLHLPPLSFENGLGGFTADGKEYVILVRPEAPTPAPWSNVLANPTFGCLVTESSLGSSWSINAGENRLTPWRNDALLDVPSEVVYLRDEETGAVWSPTPMPAGRDADTLVRHGRGFTSYWRETQGLRQELTVVVPPGSSLKIVRIRLQNRLARHRRITATYYAEWVLGALRDEQRPFVVPESHRGHACLLATNSWNHDHGDRVAFLASELPIHGLTTDRTEFLGRSGNYERPEGLARWGLSGSLEAGVDPCAALQVHLELEPDGSVETHFILGQGADRDDALALVSQFRDPTRAEQAFRECGAFWSGVLDRVRVRTPEPSMDIVLGGWLLYQTIASRLFGRTGYFQSSGAYGFRDQLQDVLALLQVAPSLARAQILEAASHQFEEGDVLHWWHPPAGRGVRTRCSDDMAWLPFVTAEYVNATGDTQILSEEVPFLSAEALTRDEHDRFARFEAAARPAPLLEHCRRALARTLPRGKHGLPFMGDGDWNDGMSRVGARGVGESVWLAWFLCATAARFASLCDRLGNGAEATRWRAEVESLRVAVENSTWDGAWYVRAFHDDGSVVGSARSKECRIDSVAQTWAVLSGVGDPERSRIAMESVERELVQERRRLVLLLHPPFQSTPHDAGYIQAYPPGVRENGGQYTHAATWVGWAHAEQGDGAAAERIFRLLNPILRTRSGAAATRYGLEPYVLAGDIYGSRAFAGRGGWSWYTGAAAWAFRLGVEAILGLRLENGDLRVDPCIPPAWPGYEAWLQVGAERVHVVVDNPERVGRGVAEVTVDGVVRSGPLHLEPSGGALREVVVRLGTALAPPRHDRPSHMVSDRGQPSS